MFDNCFTDVGAPYELRDYFDVGNSLCWANARWGQSDVGADVMTEMLSTRDMTVRSVIGSRGQTFALERPVPVRAGQRVYYGIRVDGRPLVSVASDTPIFDRVEIDTLNPDADVIGVSAAEDAPRPTQNRFIGVVADGDPYVNGSSGGGYPNGVANGWTNNGQREYRLVDAIADVADLIYRALESNGGRQIDLTQPSNNNLLIPLPRGI